MPTLQSLLLALAAAATALQLHAHALQLAPVQFAISENAAVGSVVYNLNSRITGMNQEAVVYELTSSQPSQQPLRVGRDSGSVEVASIVDREALCPARQSDRCLLLLRVTIRQEQQQQQVELEVTIVDANDNGPLFAKNSKPQYTISISESTRLPAEFSLPAAIDSDSEQLAVTGYKLLADETAQRYFHMHVVEGSHRRSSRRPKLQLIQELDREAQSSFSMRLVAFDQTRPQFNDSVGIRVQVLDANDNAPSWATDMPRRIDLPECTRRHSSLLPLRATDPDEDKRLNFSIAESNWLAGAFYISDQQLKLRSVLDFEYLGDDPIQLTIFATDAGGLMAETEVEIRLTDCNDNWPTITLRPAEVIDSDVPYLVAAILENDERELDIATIEASDLDRGENGSVQCSLMEDGQWRQFSLTPSDESLLLLQQQHSQKQQAVVYRLKKRLGVSFDREVASRVFVNILCSDHGQPIRRKSQRIEMQILDENDNAPTLRSGSYEFHIDENQPAGTYIGEIVATDPDAGVNAELTFELDAAGNQNFRLGKSAKDWTVRLLALRSFDREQQEEFRFRMFVADCGRQQRLSSTASILVRVRDQDDSAPTFNNTNYVFRLVEDFGRNSSERFVGEVAAHDKDRGDNAKVRYALDAAQSMDLQGVRFFFRGRRLFASGSLDRERHETLSLTIVAYNLGHRRHSGQATVTVSLLDVNDNRPALIGLQRAYNLSHSSPAGTQLLQLTARDPDAGANGSLRYSLSDTSGHFTIDSRHGAVTLVRSLTSRSSPARVLRLRLRAEDSGRPPLSSEWRTVFVNIVTNRAAAGRTDSQQRPLGGEQQQQQWPYDIGLGGQDNGEGHLAILLCLAAVVFVVFLALLAIIVCAHFKGRGDDCREVQGVWYDKANADVSL